MAIHKPIIQIIGPTPPPYHGVSVATHVLLDALSSHFSVAHLDTADRRGIAHVDQPDLWDVMLFARQWLAHLWTLVRKRPRICYVPLSQSRDRIFLRDSLFMIPASLSGSAVVAHLHGANFGQLYENGGRIFKWYVDAVLKRVTKFIVLAEMLKPIFHRWATAEDIVVVPNGVPECSTGREKRQETIESGLVRIVFLSTLSRQKGLFVLLDAIPLITKKYPNAEFHIAGPWYGIDTEETARSRTSGHAADLPRDVSRLAGREGENTFFSNRRYLCLSRHSTRRPAVDSFGSDVRRAAGYRHRQRMPSRNRGGWCDRLHCAATLSTGYCGARSPIDSRAVHTEHDG